MVIQTAKHKTNKNHFETAFKELLTHGLIKLPKNWIIEIS